MEWIVVGAVIVIMIIILSALLVAHAQASLRRQASDLNKEWLNIDALLKRRSDDLPRLLQICRSYMPSQQPSLRLVSESRSAYLFAKSIPEKASSNAALSSALRALFADAEQYPQLKANNTFSNLHADFTDIVERIDDRRELFNDEAERFNRRFRRTPTAWLALKMKLKPQARFEAPEKSASPNSVLKDPFVN